MEPIAGSGQGRITQIYFSLFLSTCSGNAHDSKKYTVGRSAPGPDLLGL
jgi:hypothetical protein